MVPIFFPAFHFRGSLHISGFFFFYYICTLHKPYVLLFCFFKMCTKNILYISLCKLPLPLHIMFLWDLSMLLPRNIVHYFNCCILLSVEIPVYPFSCFSKHLYTQHIPARFKAEEFDSEGWRPWSQIPRLKSQFKCLLAVLGKCPYL